MELANVSSSLCLYATAPTSPNPYDRKSLAYLYCSAPVSPRGRKQDKVDFPNSNSVDFEFETFSRKQRYRERGDSLPAVAFADQVFFSGLVMPLKLPPRLQYNSVFNSSSQRWTFAPRYIKSPTMCRIPFACKYTWNDDFDPFTAALEKIREEKKGRSGQPSCSISYSPFRIASKYSCADTISCNQDSYKDKSSMKSTNQVPALSYSGPLDLKGSAYARWVRDQKKGLNLREPKNLNGVRFGRRVKPVKNEHDGMDKPASTKGRDAKDKRGNDSGESRVEKLKGLLLKYASFGREKNVITKLTKKSVQAQKGSYFGRLSFKFRENGKRVPHDETTAVAEYKPSIISCSDY